EVLDRLLRVLKVLRVLRAGLIQAHVGEADVLVDLRLARIQAQRFLVGRERGVVLARLEELVALLELLFGPDLVAARQGESDNRDQRAKTRALPSRCHSGTAPCSFAFHTGTEVRRRRPNSVEFARTKQLGFWCYGNNPGRPAIARA